MGFHPPPGWPTPPSGWTPPPDWTPDPAWPPAPHGWAFWTDTEPDTSVPDHPHGLLQPAQHAAAGANPTVPASPPATPPPGEPGHPAPGRHATEDTQVGGDVSALTARVVELEQALSDARAGAAGDVIELSDQRILQDVGIYRYHHPLETAAAYKDRLSTIDDQVRDMVKAGQAILAADLFTFDGSLAKGRRMVADLSRLMLRAYNAEADNCVRSLRSGNISTASKRLQSAVTAIERLGSMMEMRVNPDYHALRIAELELTADYQMKIQEERERAREERELLREQRRAEQELAAERERLEKERAHYTTVLQALRDRGDNDAADKLAGRLADIERAIQHNDYRIANIRAGYVYVLSNVGAFGPDVVKIGMTRRLEPMDRVRELGDASVPFRYDVHALYFSDDAITLETQLHKAFADRRVNWVNERREFFFANPADVRVVLAQKTGNLLEYTDQPEASEYFQSLSHWPANQPDSVTSG